MTSIHPPKFSFRLRHRLLVHPRSRVGRNLAQIRPNSLLGDVMSQGRKPELWFTSSFCCYSFESCCHGWRFFPLHRRPNPPFVWSPCFPRTVQPPLAASPCSRLSRPRSTISQSDFRQVIGSPLPCRLVGPYRLCLNLTASPLFPRNPSITNSSRKVAVGTTKKSVDTKSCTWFFRNV